MPSVAKRGVWDISLSLAGARTGTATRALSFFNPLFSGPPSYPPVGSNFGFYNNPSVNSLIAQGAPGRDGSPRPRRSGAKADQAVMKDAPIYPITDPQQPHYHASYVHNAVYVPAIQQFDPTNVWLSPPG